MTDELNDSLPGLRREGATSARSVFAQLKAQVEAILFAADAILEVGEIRNLIPESSLADVRLALKDLGRDYEGRAFFLFECGGKFQLRTREEFSEIVRKQFSAKPRTLSKSALETLAIVAYRQPVTRAEVNAIRQVDSSSIMTSLKEKDLVCVAGQRKEVGSPLEYRTTQKFLEVFGLAALKDLPSLRSLQMKPDDQKQLESALATLNKGPDAVEEPITAGELSFEEIEHTPVNTAEPMQEFASAMLEAPPETESALALEDAPS